jgi:two-component system, sporulation sensor kinase E
MSQRTPQPSGSILIVDDEPSILEILERYLSARGFDVTTAETAHDALGKIAVRAFDVALIDLKLPDGAGLELIGPFKAAHPDVQCVVMTAFASLESTIEALRLDAFDYIRKPFDLIKIGEVVDAACHHVRARREHAAVLDRLADANRKLEERKEALDREMLRMNGELSAVNESLKKHVTRLRMLYQMGRDISSNENWSDALDRFLMALCKYLDAEGAGLLLFSNNEQTLKVRTVYHLESELLDRAVGLLGGAQQRDILPVEIFSLESCAVGAPKACLEMTAPWGHTVTPLLYKGRWLGFLMIAKTYASRKAYLNDYHFINTIQTILTEEVANAATISRLRSLKNFNETILENINSGVLTTDGGGMVIYLNGRAREMLGTRAAGELSFNDLFVNPFGSGPLFEYLVSREGASSSFEAILVGQGGGAIPVGLNTTTVKLDEHHGPTVIVIFEDLTARKLMEEELRRADRLRSLGELSAGIAHEIRNPLTGIATTAQVLREKLGEDEDKVRYLGVILDEIARLDDIIKHLLHFARPVTPSAAELRLATVIEEALELLADRSRERGVSLHFETALTDDRCLLDGDQIKQVILNIALNGIQACEAGGTVTVTMREGSNAAFVQIELTDTGSGIPDEISDKLYDPFFTTKPEGTGMGLSISRKIAESHGGRIYHRSGPAGGTSFFVELPRRMAVSGRKETAKVP